MTVIPVYLKLLVDHLEAAAQAASFLYFQPDAKMSSAACDCSGAQSDDLTRKCRYRTADEMKQIVASGKGSTIALRDHKNYSEGLLFLDPVHGLFGSFSFDALHTIQKGLLLNIRDWVISVFSSIGLAKLRSRGEDIIADGGGRTSSRDDFFVFKKNYPSKMVAPQITETSASENASVLALLLLSIAKFSDWDDNDIKRKVGRAVFTKALQAFADSFWFLVGIDRMCLDEDVPVFEQAVLDNGLSRIAELGALAGNDCQVSKEHAPPALPSCSRPC